MQLIGWETEDPSKHTLIARAAQLLFVPIELTNEVERERERERMIKIHLPIKNEGDENRFCTFPWGDQCTHRCHFFSMMMIIRTLENDWSQIEVNRQRGNFASVEERVPLTGAPEDSNLHRSDQCCWLLYSLDRDEWYYSYWKGDRQLSSARCC